MIKATVEKIFEVVEQMLLKIVTPNKIVKDFWILSLTVFARALYLDPNLSIK